MATQAERSEATRGKILDAARALFAKDGYAATAIDAVTRAAGLTKGAFYHHFPDKQSLFRAVFEETERELLETAARRATGPDAWRRFRAGCRAFLEASLEPAVQRIAFRDAPAVLGWEDWRETDARYSVGLIERGLRAAMDEGRVAPRSPETMARLLFGTLCEGARMMAAAPDPRTRARVLREVDELIASIASPAPLSRRRSVSAKPAAARTGRRRAGLA